MISAELNLPDHDLPNTASYIAHWLERLRSDRKEIFRAAAEAQRIADYLLAFHPDYAERNDHAGAVEDAGKEAPDMRGESAACVAEAA